MRQIPLYVLWVVACLIVPSSVWAQCSPVDLMYYQLHNDTHPVVKGKAVNTVNESVKFVQIHFKLLDQNDTVLKTVSDMTVEMEPKGEWFFEASGTVDGVESAEFMKFDCQD